MSKGERNSKFYETEPDKRAVKHWTKTAMKWLVGKKIVACRYMTPEEIDEAMWNDRPICLLLDDGTWIIPQSDDEGNDGGSLYVTNEAKEKNEILPVI